MTPEYNPIIDIAVIAALYVAVRIGFWIYGRRER